MAGAQRGQRLDGEGVLRGAVLPVHRAQLFLQGLAREAAIDHEPIEHGAEGGAPHLEPVEEGIVHVGDEDGDGGAGHD